MRLRQVALVARALRPVVDDITSVFGVEVGYNDPGVKKYGLENAVIPIGDTFLEVVAPVQDGTTAGRLLDKRGGDGGYMVILQTYNLEADRARVEKLGVRIVDRFDGPSSAFTHLHPRDVGGAILSLDAMEPKEKWDWAGPKWREHVRTEVATGITGVEVQSNDPEAMAHRWSEVLAIPAEERADSFVIPLEGGHIRFVTEQDGRGEGVSGVDLTVRTPSDVVSRARSRGLTTSPGEVDLCGTRFRFSS